jgi:hypothetical protein
MLSVYLSETYEVYEERMRAELKRWEEAGNVTKNGSTGQPGNKHCKFSKPVLCWCLYHVNKSHHEWAHSSSFMPEDAKPFMRDDWQNIVVGPTNKACPVNLHTCRPSFLILHATLPRVPVHTLRILLPGLPTRPRFSST